MSFRCEGCKQIGEKPTRVVLKTRTHKHMQDFVDDRGYPVRVQTGVGEQIVKEANLCGPCAGK